MDLLDFQKKIRECLIVHQKVWKAPHVLRYYYPHL